MLDGSPTKNPNQEQPRLPLVCSVRQLWPPICPFFLTRRLHQDPAWQIRLHEAVPTFQLPNSTPSTKSVQRFAVQRRTRRTSGSLMLHQCPCGGVVRCNGWFDGNGRDQCDSSARAIPRSPNFATDLATTDSLTFPHRRPSARIAANGAPLADGSLAAVANIFLPASIRGTFTKPTTVRRTPCR
jgi:hypothetical protein